VLITLGVGALAADIGALVSARIAVAATPLRVCADPDNMPFSNAESEGFENRLATLLAADLGKPLTSVWIPQPQAVADALDTGRCDVVMGVPDQFAGLDTTRPYYWSSYVLISRADRALDVSSLKDHRLRSLKIGVASVGGDDLYSPPAHVLAGFKLAPNLVPFPIDGDDSAEQRARIVDAVTKGDVDIAAVWGPLAGYFIKRSPVPLTVTPIGDTDEFSSRKVHFELLGLQYQIAMGVRRGNAALRQSLDEAIGREQPRIDAILTDYEVPLLKPTRILAITAGDAAADGRGNE
jgi:quinoprotein dehydrogenase-associated probable ABC transporter substrate-binding protein